MVQKLDTVTDYSASEQKATHDFVKTTERFAWLNAHLRKVMVRVILDRLVNQAEQILEEEQPGFRLQRSTTEKMT